MSEYSNSQRHKNFCVAAAWRWVQDNQPEVARAIREEAERKWPSTIKKSSKHDYSFLEKIKPLEGQR